MIFSMKEGVAGVRIPLFRPAAHHPFFAHRLGDKRKGLAALAARCVFSTQQHREGDRARAVLIGRETANLVGVGCGNGALAMGADELASLIVVPNRFGPLNYLIVVERRHVGIGKAMIPRACDNQQFVKRVAIRIPASEARNLLSSRPREPACKLLSPMGRGRGARFNNIGEHFAPSPSDMEERFAPPIDEVPQRLHIEGRQLLDGLDAGALVPSDKLETRCSLSCRLGGATLIPGRSGRA